MVGCGSFRMQAPLHPLFRAGRSWLRAGLAGLLLGAAGWAQEPPKSWTDRDTLLANEYLALLVSQPEYGRVVDLLWQLYERHGATPLLLENIAAQVQASRHASVLLVQGHLLRRSGDLRAAAALYDEVLQREPLHLSGLRARADVARELADAATAATLVERLAEALPEADPRKAPAWVEVGHLALAAGRNNAAADAWERAVRLSPQDAGLARQVAELLLRAGFADRAAALYGRLAEQGDPQRRLDAWLDLARILEQADQFAKADAALRQGLALLDFRDARYTEFFRRRVRLHERFGALDDLREQLRQAVKAAPAGEQALRDQARFHEITVDPDAHLAALRALVQAVPQVDDYRWELVRALLDQEGAAEAARLLDARMQGDGSDLPALVFLRCEADLRAGAPAVAVARLKKLLEAQGRSADVEKQALQFAQARALDAVVEWILQARVGRDPGRAEAVFELAGFHRARKNGAEADRLLRRFADQAATETERQRRLNDAAAFQAAGSDLDSAIALAREAAAKPGAGREEWLRLADLLSEQGDAEAAAGLLEKAWAASPGDEERLEVDERLFAVLLGEEKVEAPVSASGTAGEFKLPDAFTGKGFASSDPVEPEKPALPEAVTAKASDLARAAAGGEPPALLRAAWWAFRTERLDEAYALLLRLQTGPVGGRPRELPLEAEKLLLDLALTDKNRALAMRVLRRLMQRDPGARVACTLRLAELLMEAEQSAVAAVQNSRWRQQSPEPLPVARATELLEQAYREAPDSGQLLSALTQAYTLQRRPEQALKLWGDAVNRSQGAAAVPLLERQAELLLRQQKLPEYLAVQMRLIGLETEVKRRREAFKRCLDRLLWTEQGGELAQEAARERLKLLTGVLEEQSRLHPFDGFYYEALAQVHERDGQAAKAFAAMKQAYYTAPETPFSLAQLRDAALRVADVKAAIYFQKQVAAAAPAAELAAELRRLVELLEQTFQIAEADRVRRRMESRFSQDAEALEKLAEYYRSTGQDEAERRVYEQVARIRSWDARSQLRLALKCLRLADDAAAERHLREILERTQATPEPPAGGPEHLPLPLSEVRKAGAPGAVRDVVEVLDSVSGLEEAEVKRLRAFLNLPRPELAELPEPPGLVRLRAIEELARLRVRDRPEPALRDWVARWMEARQAPVERLWALHAAGAGPEFRRQLRQALAGGTALEPSFCLLWLTLRSHGMQDALEWAGQAGLAPEVREQRRRLLQAVVSMLADLDSFRFAPGELAALGASRLLMNAPVLELTRQLQDQQRYAEALELGESLRRHATALADDYAFFLSRIAESAERWDLARQYLDLVVRGPVLPGPYRGTYDPYLYSLGTASRLARSEQEREQTLGAAWRRLQSVPDSGLTRLRKSAVAGLAGAEQTAAAQLQDFLAGDFLSARRMAEPKGMLMPQGSTRHEEPLHLRGLWEETREIQASLVQQGLAPVVQRVNDRLSGAWGAVGLSARTGLEFGEWRLGHLLRRLRQSDYPNRLRLIREHLAGVDMRLEISVETLSELGGRLESSGMPREAIEVYRRLPERAPANPEYAQWLIRASEAARETRMGLKFTLQLLLAEPPMKPPQPGDELLREKHAHFLAEDLDQAELHRRGFLPAVTRVLQGRIPHEVPYLRELALLHERLGQDAEALAAWERLHLAFVTNAERGIRADAESCLHRARLLQRAGRKPEALAALREVPLTEASGGLGREALQLRAALVAETGGWEEFRELMAVAVERKSVPAIVRLAALLSDHGRALETLNFLTQAERRVQDDADRFRLRLELLRRMARDPAWTPERGRAQIAALWRVRSRDRDALQALVDWMTEQGRGPNRAAWVALLRAEARAGTDRAAAALALSALAQGLPASAREDLRRGWNAAGEGDRVVLEVGAETLLALGQGDWAWDACQVLQVLPTLRLDGRKLPLMVRVAHARQDRVTVRELFAEAVRMGFPGGARTAEWAGAFAAAGEPQLARELYLAALKQLEATQASQPEIGIAWARFLIRQREFEAAEVFLMREGWAWVKDSPRLIFELYQAWGKLASLEAELPKFHLAGGVEKEVLFLRRRPPPPAQP